MLSCDSLRRASSLLWPCHLDGDDNQHDYDDEDRNDDETEDDGEGDDRYCCY